MRPIAIEKLKLKMGFASDENNSLIKKFIPFIGLIIIVALFSILTQGRTLRFVNLKLILLQSVIMMIAGIGLTFTISHGSLDFSLGGVMILSAALGARAGEISPGLTLPVCIVIGLACSLTVVGLHLLLKVPVFLTGISMMFLTQGITGTLSAQKPLVCPYSLMYLDEPIVYYGILIGIFVFAYIIFEFTKTGKYNKAIGSNQTAAVVSGIRVNKYKVLAFIISGILIGMCGFLSLLRSGGVASSSSGMGFEVLISLVLGGVSITGGAGTKLRATIIGCLILTILSNGLSFLSVEPAYIGAIKGIIFLAAIALTYERKAGEIVL